MSFVRPTLTTIFTRIRTDIAGRLTGAAVWLARSVLGVLARAIAGAVDGLYGYLDSIAANVMPDTADDDHVLRWASIWGVAPKADALASGPVQIAGAAGAIVPASSTLLRADGTAFVTGDAVALVAGAATLTVTAAIAGAAGNTGAGTALLFASPALGVGATATVAAGGLVGGADEESGDSLRARLVSRIQTPPSGGSQSDYVTWALAQPEVTRAWVYPGWLGAGTVGLAIVMDARDDIFPGDADCDAVADAIDPLRPVTATLIVFAPTPLQQSFSIALTPSTAATKAAVQAELDDLFAREAAPGATMPISHIREAISQAAGVTDYRLPVPVADIVPGAGIMPTRGAISWLN